MKNEISKYSVTILKNDVVKLLLRELKSEKYLGYFTSRSFNIFNIRAKLPTSSIGKIGKREDIKTLFDIVNVEVEYYKISDFEKMGINPKNENNSIEEQVMYCTYWLINDLFKENMLNCEIENLTAKVISKLRKDGKL